MRHSYTAEASSRCEGDDIRGKMTAEGLRGLVKQRRQGNNSCEVQENKDPLWRNK